MPHRALEESTSQSPQQPTPGNAQYPKNLDILILGGSTTWGALLKNRAVQSYAALLSKDYSNKVINNAIRATGSDYPSHCIESMVGFRDEDFDVIVLEFSLNGHEMIDLLLQRLRARYPDAIMIYVHLYSFQVDIEDDKGMTPFLRNSRDPTISWHWGKNERASNQIFKEVREILKKYDGHIFSLPRTTHVMNSRYLFGHDWHHLSPEGHKVVAAGIMNILKEVVPKQLVKPPRKGTWGNGDECVNWFMDGRIPLEFTGNAEIRSFEGFGGSNKFALQFKGEGSIIFNNSKDFPVPFYISFMTKDDNYPVVQLEFDGKTAKVDPRTWWLRHVMQTKHIGWAKPGRNEVKIKPLTGWLLPFRITAINLCGACIDLQNDEEQKQNK